MSKANKPEETGTKNTATATQPAAAATEAKPEAAATEAKAEAAAKEAKPEAAAPKAKAEAAPSVEELLKKVEELQQVVSDQAEEILAKDKAKGKLTVVVPGHGHMKVKCGTTFNKKKYTAEELQANPEVCAELVAIGSGVIQKLDPQTEKA